MTDLPGLLERVKKCEGDHSERTLLLMAYNLLVPANDRFASRFFAFLDAGAFTDAALGLVERVLPGAVWHVMTDYGDLNRAKIGPKDNPSASIYRCGERPLFTQADGATPPLAILAAFLAALIANPDLARVKV